jgi:hypothetical protein
MVGAAPFDARRGRRCFPRLTNGQHPEGDPAVTISETRALRVFSGAGTGGG